MVIFPFWPSQISLRKIPFHVGRLIKGIVSQRLVRAPADQIWLTAGRMMHLTVICQFICAICPGTIVSALSERKKKQPDMCLAPAGALFPLEHPAGAHLPAFFSGRWNKLCRLPAMRAFKREHAGLEKIRSQITMLSTLCVGFCNVLLL